MSQQPPVLKHQIRLSFAAKNLKSKDLTSPSDPSFSLHKVSPDGTLDHITTSPAMLDTNDPVWGHSVDVEHDLEANQKFLITINDYDQSGGQVSYDFIGSAIFSLTDDIYDGITIPLTKEGKVKPSKKMQVIIKGQRKVPSNLHIKADFRCTDLKKTRFFSKDTTAISLSRINPDKTESQVYLSEFIESSQKPDWAPFTLSFSDLCDADLNTAFALRLWRMRSDGYMEWKGVNLTLTVQDCLVKSGEAEKKIDLFDPNTGKDICDVWIERFELYEVHPETSL